MKVQASEDFFSGKSVIIIMKGGVLMPTFNQLVKSGRASKSYKSTAPALQSGLNTLHKRQINISAPQ